MPSKYSLWLEMQSFSRCIHFLKASRYADLGTVIRYWWMGWGKTVTFSFFKNATLTRCLFCSSVNRCGTLLAEIFLTFKCFFKIKWTVYSDMPTFRAISWTVNLASPSKISFILETISLRDADFGLPDFGAFFDELYTRLKFLFPPPNCVIRHTRRSKSSRNFSHQLLQRTTKFWASFDVSPYFIFFVDASTNHFYCSGQWLRVFKWQILCLTLSPTCTFIHRCVDIE